jgi:hypothetical protein
MEGILILADLASIPKVKKSSVHAQPIANPDHIPTRGLGPGSPAAERVKQHNKAEKLRSKRIIV